MKVSSATDSNNNSLVVEEKDEEATSGVEIIATETEESSSFNATAVDRAAAPKRKTTNKFYITVGSLVVAAVVGVASFAGSNIRSSKQQVVAALMNEEVDGYEFKGNGLCKDGNGDGNYYDYILFDDISLQACGERCSVCPGNNNAGLVFRGFRYWKDEKQCGCLVDDIGSDDATFVTLECACEDVDGAEASSSGKGEIQGADGSTNFVCYKKSEGGKSKSSKRGKANNEAGGM